MARHACGGILNAGCLLLCALMVVTAAGCGSGGDSANDDSLGQSATSNSSSSDSSSSDSSSSSSSSSSAAPGNGAVTLNWTEPTINTNGTPLTDLVGYTIKYGTNASALEDSVSVDDPSTTSYTVQSLTEGQVWYFAIVADASDGTQSSLSNVVSTTVQ
jgi:hypothetical protein